MGPNVMWDSDDEENSGWSSGGKIRLSGSVFKGNVNIAVGAGAGKPKTNTTSFREGNGDEWMQWHNDKKQAEICLSGYWHVLDPTAIKDQHPLDFGHAIETEGKTDLAEIRAQYEQHINSSPWLQKLRRDYDKLSEKHDLFDAIKGSDDA